MTPLSIGQMLPSERGFCWSSWMRSYEHCELKHLTRPAYWSHFGSLVDGLLDAGETLVARNPEDETHIFGFVCRAKADMTLHYVYVKRLMRYDNIDKLDIAKRLLRAAGVEQDIRCTFSTVAWLKYAAKHGIQFEHDRTLVAVTRAAARRAPREEAI